MRNAKCLVALLLALCMTVCLCACGANPSNSADDNTTNSEDTTTTTTKTDDGKVTYTVTVVDSEGNPIVGAFVQLCLDACIPAATDAQGKATYNVAKADYKVSFVSVPEGYICENNEFHFADGAYDLTITLTKA